MVSVVLLVMIHFALLRGTQKTKTRMGADSFRVHFIFDGLWLLLVVLFAAWVLMRSIYSIPLAIFVASMMQTYALISVYILAPWLYQLRKDPPVRFELNVGFHRRKAKIGENSRPRLVEDGEFDRDIRDEYFVDSSSASNAAEN